MADPVSGTDSSNNQAIIDEIMNGLIMDMVVMDDLINDANFGSDDEPEEPFM
ncbi:MAG TPA: hypothetical protein VFX23_15025 [Limnobacter sp.]|uniref:hypothetical protein n=1 Tax=Limnobacter sp. TaxID=2003368 RepID=UPI002E365B42|nr:hypothetical protein [Limnobacter sp.]HEX5487298.1 hypothetical protein [Limnobacter sp.]